MPTVEALEYSYIKILTFVSLEALKMYCVMRASAPSLYSVYRRYDILHHVIIVKGSTGCGTFTGLPPGEHRVRAISRERLPGQGGVRFTSDFHYFSTE